MRSCKTIILHFLLLSLCFAHDLNHVDPVSAEKSDASAKTWPAHDTTQNSREPSSHTLDSREARAAEHTTRSVKKRSTTQAPVSSSNDFVTPSTPVRTSTTQQSSTAATVMQVETDIPVSRDSPAHEQVKPSPDHIPTPSTTQRTVSTTVPSTLADSRATITPKPADTLSTHTSTAKPESQPPTPTPLRALRSAAPKANLHPRHTPEPTENAANKVTTPPATTQAPPVRTETAAQPSTPDPNSEKKSSTQPKEQPAANIDLPRQVRVHPTATILAQQQGATTVSTTTEQTNLTQNKEASSNTTTATTSTHDANAHLPRTQDLNEKPSIGVNMSQTNETEIKNASVSNSSAALNVTDKLDKNRLICWQLPKRFEPSIELLENQLFRLLNTMPDFVQTVFFGRIDDREVLMNTMWFGSVCTMCTLFSFLFLSMGTKRLKQTKAEKVVRARCQQLQQYNNQIELEKATFERQNQKLSDEIDELKSIPVRDADEDIFALREECARFTDDLKSVRAERDALQQNVDFKQNVIQKHEYEMQRQVETVAYLNNEILQLKEALEKERATISRYQSNDLSLERFEKSQEQIQELKSEVTQLKQEKFAQKDQLDELQEQANQLDIEKSQLVARMKQLRDLLEQRDQTIKRIEEKFNENEPEEIEGLRSLLTNLSSNDNKPLLSTVDTDLEKSSQHMRDLHHDIDEKARRIKELDLLLKQEKDRCKEMETKLKVVLELRERDAHLHIRQLGQTDAELRKARNDTERVRILQQQLDLKQQQLDDVQKVLSTEQLKFNEECSKLQHDTHEKWMEVKRLARELDVSKKECEGLRKQITKYANNERSSQEKTVIKPVPQHFGANGELETNGASPKPYQQVENFRPIDHQRNDSGATSPAEMFMPRPPLFGFPRPPFFPAPNAFLMHPRFPMPTASPHGMISPLSHLMINGNDANKSENADSLNITPSSTSYTEPSNERILSPQPENEKPVKTKKTKKSSKKKGDTSAVKENL